MSAPSTEHEDRVELLRSIATLSGYCFDIPVGEDFVPDVARLSRATRGVFVGDAKATETSGCIATSERLQNYLRAVRAQQPLDCPVILVVAHGDLYNQYGWIATIKQVLHRCGCGLPDTVGSLRIDEDCALAYATYRHAGRDMSGT